MSRSTAPPEVSDGDVEALVEASRALIGVAVLSMSEVADRITLVQFRALLVLTEAGTLKAHDLAHRLGVSASSVTRLCDRLAADGLLERVANPASRREVLLTPTRQGRALVKRVLDHRRRELRRILAGLASDDRSSAASALERFAAQARAVHSPLTPPDWSVAPTTP